MKYYIGVDIGGTKCAVVLGDEQGNVLQKIKFPTTGRDETLEKILQGCKDLKNTAPDGVIGVGISCGGPLDSTRGIIQSPPNLPGWDNVEIVKMITQRIGLPAILCNDANACALAEWRFGAGKGAESMIFLTFGTGMGAGIVLNGRIYNGVNGNAGEIGHVRLERFGPVGYGKQGSVEGFASGGGIAMMARSAALEKLQQGIAPAYCPDAASLDTISAKTVAQAADAGDETALSVYALCGRMLGRTLSILIDILNPDKIVIGSIYQRSRHLLERTMRETLREECLPASLAAVEILPAALGDEIGDIAALSLAMSLEDQ